jgi:DNA-directed RNA polymerase subunit L
VTLSEIRAQHVTYCVPHAVTNEPVCYCKTDDEDWPCDTAVVLAALDNALERIDELSEELADTYGNPIWDNHD